MPCFAEIEWCRERGFKFFESIFEIAFCEGVFAQGKVRTNVLTQWPALASLPGLKLAAAHEFAGALGLSYLVMKRTDLNCQIIALPNQLKTLFQFDQPCLRADANPFPKLVALINKTRVGWPCLAGSFIGGPCFGGLVENVEVTDSQI